MNSCMGGLVISVNAQPTKVVISRPVWNMITADDGQADLQGAIAESCTEQRWEPQTPKQGPSAGREHCRWWPCIAVPAEVIDCTTLAGLVAVYDDQSVILTQT